LLVYRRRVTYHWKALDKSYNFAWNCISIEGLFAKLWGSQVAGVPTLAISGLPFGTKSHLDVGSMASHRIYYKGEGGDFPQVWAVVSLVCLCCPWLILTPKVLQLCTNHLVWVLCRPVWMNEACQLFLVPSWSSSMPLYPSKCCEPRSVPRLLLRSLFSTWIHIWIPQGDGSASMFSNIWKIKIKELSILCISKTLRNQGVSWWNQQKINNFLGGHWFFPKQIENHYYIYCLLFIILHPFGTRKSIRRKVDHGE
jgi:hypothetical protein